MKLRIVFFLILLVGLSQLIAAQSSPQYVQGTDTLVTYSDVPGLTPSDKYTIRVRSAATNDEWVDVFVNYTYNRAAELGGVSLPQTDGTYLNTTVKHYAKFTSAWSHAYGNIEMSRNTPVVVEIAAKNGFKIGNQNFFKATVHPSQKASVATISNGKVYFTISNPGQLVIDINGQMDDYNAAINGGIGHPVHAISLFANPVIKKPSLNGSRVRYIEVGTDSAAMRQIDPASYDTLCFRPGVFNAGKDFKIYPGKVYYFPGDAMFYGNINNLGVPPGGYSKNGESIKVFGYGTISGAKITHPNYVPNATGAFNGFKIENGLNYVFHGVTIADPANHSVYTIGGSNGLFNWAKVISWRANGDGIGGYEPTLNCFIRTQDDCSYAKGYKKGCTFWKDANAALFHLATITENLAEPVIMEDCDVIYARLRDAVGNNGGGFQQRGEGVPGQRNVNVIFRDIRIHDKLVNMSIFHLVSYSGGTADAPTEVGSSYKGFLFQNISIAGMASGNKQRILGCEAAPWYGGLIFDNVTIGDTKVTKQNYTTYFNTNEYVKYLLFAMPQDVTLTTNADPAKGTVTRNPDQSTYLETSEVTLNATGKSGYIFSHWTDDLTGTTNPVTVVVDKNMTITANFVEPDFSQDIEIVAPGTNSFTIPVGIDSVTVKLWGAGGAGGSASNATNPVQSRGGGGAGGGFALVKKKVTAGQVLSYTIGAGGIAAPLGFANNTVNAVQNGAQSSASINSIVVGLAKGGPGGQNIAGVAGSGTGGAAPQSGNTGDKVYYGGNGGTANSSSTGSGGGSAGAAGNGGNATIGSTAGGIAGAGGGAVGGNGINSTNVGNPGNDPGAGGSGAAVRISANTSMKGGDGADGKIIFSFTTATYQISISVNGGVGGAVSGGGTFANGQSVTVTATPASNYRFVNWTENNVEVSTNASYIFTATQARTLVANFEIISTPTIGVTLTQIITTTGAGTWTCPSGVQSVTVECWGGGGAGGSTMVTVPGSAYSARARAGGGAGGSFAKFEIDNPSGSYSYTVGAGGIGVATNFTDGAFADGGNTTFGGTTVVAVGGNGGKSRRVSDGTHTFGEGGMAKTTGNIPSTGSFGGAGGTGSSTGAGGGGGSAGPDGAGGSTSNQTAGIGVANGGADGGAGATAAGFNAGVVGGNPGAGGSGSSSYQAGGTTSTTQYQKGGNGGNGQIKITSTAATITISNGETLTIPNGATLTVKSGALLTVASGGVLLVQSGGVLNVEPGGMITNTGTITNNGTINYLSDATNGTATVLNTGTIGGTTGTTNINQSLQHQSGALRSWYVSAPVASFAPIGFSTIKYFDETNANGNTWTSTSTMLANRGYLVTPAAAANNLFFTGALNNGNIDVSITRRSGTENSPGLNLIGNPYLSYLDWKAVCDYSSDGGTTYPNRAIMSTNTMWYRTKTSVFFVFVTVNGVGITSPANIATNYIPPMQAFWVRAKNAGTSTLKLTNAMRSHTDAVNNPGPNLLKAPAAKNSELQIVRLQVSNGMNTDEAVIYFSENALNIFDRLDAPKMNNDNQDIPELFTTLGTERIVINAMRSMPMDTPIGLGFVAGNASSFSIIANEVSNLPSGVKLILRDNVTFTETDLTDGVSTYEFSPEITSNDRFSIIFRSPGTITNINSAEKHQIKVFVSGANQIVIIAAEKNNYAVFNALGMLIDKGFVNNKLEKLSIKLDPGVYVVNVNNQSTKVIIK